MTKPAIADLQAELASLRAMIAGTDTATVAVPVKTSGPAEAGDLIHFLRPILFAGEVRERASEMILTAELVAEFPDLLAAPGGAWGYGSAKAAGVKPWAEIGDPDWERLYREGSRAIRARTLSEDERNEAFAALNEEFEFGSVSAVTWRATQNKWAV